MAFTPVEIMYWLANIYECGDFATFIRRTFIIILRFALCPTYFLLYLEPFNVLMDAGRIFIPL